MKTSVLAGCRHNCASRHSGARSEPGISNFRVWSFGPSRNDEQDYQSAPRSRGLSAPVSQSADSAGMEVAVQSLRRSSAWANNSASLGSFPAVSSIRRFSMQPIAARRGGGAPPSQDQPENTKLGASVRLIEP